MAVEGAAEKPQVFLEGDEEIRGQKYVCLSFLTPNRGILRNKDLYFFSKFLEFFEMNHRINATESFLMGTFNNMQNALSDIEMDLRNANFSDVSGCHETLLALSEKVKKQRAEISRKTTGDLEAHVKANLSDFRETAIVETYEKYMLKNRERLEDEFHKQQNFQTTMHGLKVRGVYSSQEQANARAKALNKKDPYFNVYVADVGEWLPWDPNPDEVKDQEYQSDDLNKLMKSYKENAEKRDEFFEEEKRQKVAAAAAAVKEAKAAGAVPTLSDHQEKAAKEKETKAADMFSTDGHPDLAIARKKESIEYC
jgi:cation transport regulator ChaB